MTLKYPLILSMVLVFPFANNQAQTKIIAHRGFSGVAPENTLVAFQKAIDIDAEYLELDVHRSKDNTVIVIHDSSVDRTSSNSKKGKVAEMTDKELQEVKAGYTKRFGDEFKDERLPTLKEALELAKGKIKVCIEIKVQGIENEVLQLVEQLDMEDEVIIFSFSYPVLTQIRHLNSSIDILFLKTKADQQTLKEANAIKASAVGVGGRTRVTKEFITQAHKLDLEVWKWTVDDEEEMQELFTIGLDGLITNYPDKALEILKKE